MDLRERYIDTNDIKLHVIESGPSDGPMLLFLHGFPEFWYAWRKQIGYFADKGYLVVVPDQRGYNLSDKPAGIDSYGIKELTDDMIGLIDAYGKDKIFLVGHDWGATVSWWLSLRYPQRIKKMVIINVPHPKVLAKNLFGNMEQMQRSWYIFYFQLPGVVEKQAESSNYDWALQIITSNAKPGAFTDQDIEEYRKAFSQAGAFSAMVNWYRASLQIKPPVPESFDVNVPLLFLWGMDDVSMLSVMADESMEYCKNGELIKLQGVSHWVQHEDAENVNRMIEGFIRD